MARGLSFWGWGDCAAAAPAGATLQCATLSSLCQVLATLLRSPSNRLAERPQLASGLCLRLQVLASQGGSSGRDPESCCPPARSHSSARRKVLQRDCAPWRGQRTGPARVTPPSSCRLHLCQASQGSRVWVTAQPTQGTLAQLGPRAPKPLAGSLSHVLAEESTRVWRGREGSGQRRVHHLPWAQLSGLCRSASYTTGCGAIKSIYS